MRWKAFSALCVYPLCFFFSSCNQFLLISQCVWDGVPDTTCLFHASAVPAPCAAVSTPSFCAAVYSSVGSPEWHFGAALRVSVPCHRLQQPAFIPLPTCDFRLRCAFICATFGSSYIGIFCRYRLRYHQGPCRESAPDTADAVLLSAPSHRWSLTVPQYTASCIWRFIALCQLWVVLHCTLFARRWLEADGIVLL